MTSATDSVREARLRQHARRLGFVLVKSRARNLTADDHGGYMILDEDTNTVVSGSRFDLDLDLVEAWLNDLAEQA